MKRGLIALAWPLLLASCYPMKQHRASSQPTALSRDCKPDSDAKACSFILTERAGAPSKYTLAVVELDDQGTAYSPLQLDRAVELLSEKPGAADTWAGQIVVAYAHGWFHDARPGDTNLALFAELLEVMSASESSAAKAAARAPRRVVGIYLAWRGASARFGKYLTFWNRKETAHRIGEREAMVALTRVRRAVYEAAANTAKRNRFIVLGHSFGAALIYSALSQLVTNTLLDPPAKGAKTPPVADAIILFNAAFEAGRLHHLLRYLKPQQGSGPTLALFTSKSDGATRVAFRMGRRLDTLFLNFREIANPLRTGAVQQRPANANAIGHFAPYVTHDLRTLEKAGAACQRSPHPIPTRCAARARPPNQPLESTHRGWATSCRLRWFASPPTTSEAGR